MNNRQPLTIDRSVPRDERQARPAHHHAAAPAPVSAWAAIKQTWADPERWVGIAVAAAPSLVFVAVNLVATLYSAIIAAAVTAAAGLGYRLVRRQSPRSALVGSLVVAVGAVLAAITGEARGFFLVPALIPFAVILICLATLVAVTIVAVRKTLKAQR